jgi:two-component system response regulator WspF
VNEVRVGIAHPSLAAIEVLRKAVESLPRHVVAWTSRDAEDGIRRAAYEGTAIVLLAVDLPGSVAATTVRTLRARTNASVLLVRGDRKARVDDVYDAMEAGAVDVVDLPGLTEAGTLEGVAPLMRKLEVAARLAARRAGAEGSPPSLAPVAASAPTKSARARSSRLPGAKSLSKRPPVADSLVAIGASTGGPDAICRVLTSLTRPFPGAIVLVQHIDEAFASTVATWLSQSSGIRVSIARNGDEPRCGEALLAGTGDHLRLEADGRLAYVREPVAYPYRPSVDVFFDSMAANYRGTGVGVLLTGMGRDGASGLMALRRAGHRTIAQNENSSVVYGMPRAAVELGAAMDVLDLGQIGPSIEHALRVGKVFAGR